MLARLSLASLLCAPAFALAAIPVVNTDAIGDGELLAVIAANFRSTATNVTLVFPTATFVGKRDLGHRQQTITLLHGLSDTLSWDLTATSAQDDETIDVQGPTHAVFNSQERGFDDLVVGVHQRYTLRDDWALMPALHLRLPTASDDPGRTGVTVNGIQTVSRETGAPGSGSTELRAGLAASKPLDHGALELGATLSLADNDTSQFSRSASVAWIWLPSSTASLRVGLMTSFLESSNNDSSYYQSSVSSTGAWVAGEWQPDTTTRLYAGASHVLFGNARARSVATGADYSFRDGNSSEFSLGVQLLLR